MHRQYPYLINRNDKMKKYNCIKTERTLPAPVTQSGVKQSTLDPKLIKALSLMRGIVRSPLGSNPERDKKIKQAWESGS